MALLLRRFSAYLIDRLIIISFYGMMFFLFSLFPQERFSIGGIPMAGIWFFLSLLVTGWLYHAFFESSPWRATPGKRLLKLEVSTFEGKTLSFFQSTMRQIARFFLSGLFYVGLFFPPKFTRLTHDFVSGSRVYKVPRPIPVLPSS